MRTLPETRRFILAIGDASDEVPTLDGVRMIQRLDGASLVETEPSLAELLRRVGGALIHVYDSEKAARTALSLFDPLNTCR